MLIFCSNFWKSSAILKILHEQFEDLEPNVQILRFDMLSVVITQVLHVQ